MNTNRPGAARDAETAAKLAEREAAEGRQATETLAASVGFRRLEGGMYARRLRSTDRKASAEDIRRIKANNARPFRA
jgi:hypothetical protein